MFLCADWKHVPPAPTAEPTATPDPTPTAPPIPTCTPICASQGPVCGDDDCGGSRGQCSLPDPL
eukprot:7514681-Pyramimonas_sp.AAC.1